MFWDVDEDCVLVGINYNGVDGVWTLDPSFTWAEFQTPPADKVFEKILINTNAGGGINHVLLKGERIFFAPLAASQGTAQLILQQFSAVNS